MLNWAGKSEAYRILQAQTCKTLTPQPAESVNFDSTENIFIEGENLDVLKVLQKSYFNSIKMIYIDPPYNTGNDFVYNDNFKQDLKDYQEQSGELDEEGKLKLAFKKNSKENGHFHSKWLNMMLPRLHLAKNLLKDDGVIFISIDDNEQAQLKLLCDEVFGGENFIAQVTWHRKRGKDNSAPNLSRVHEYLFIYAKDIQNINFNKLEIESETLKAYKNPDNDERGAYRILGLWARGNQGGSKYEYTTQKGIYYSEREWLVGFDTMQKLDMEKRLIENGDKLYRKLFLSEIAGSVPETIWLDTSNTANAADELKQIFNKKTYFDTPKPIPYLIKMGKLATNSDDLVLDFFSGSGTTAHAVMQLNAEDNSNRRFICVQLPEILDEKSEAFKAGFKNIAEISKERIRRAGKQIAENHPDKQLDIGFKVFKLTDSHFKQWQSPSAENLAQQIELFVDPLRKEAAPNAMLYEILLRLGLKLTAKVRSENQVFWVSDENGQQFALLLETLSADLLDQVISAQPKKVVTLDSLFNGDDALKKNAELQMNDAGIAFFVL